MGAAHRFNRIAGYTDHVSDSDHNRLWRIEPGQSRCPDWSNPGPLETHGRWIGAPPRPLNRWHRVGGPAAAVLVSVVATGVCAALMATGVAEWLGYPALLSAATVKALFGGLGLVCGVLAVYSTSVAVIVACEDEEAIDASRRGDPFSGLGR